MAVKKLIVFEANQIKFLAYLSDPQNWNRYGYVLNNPLTLSDPDGREPNKAQAGTVQQIVAVIQQIERNNPGASRTEVLEQTARQFEGMIDAAPGNIRYVYLMSGHFLKKGFPERNQWNADDADAADLHGYFESHPQ